MKNLSLERNDILSGFPHLWWRHYQPPAIIIQHVLSPYCVYANSDCQYISIICNDGCLVRSDCAEWLHPHFHSLPVYNHRISTSKFDSSTELSQTYFKFRSLMTLMQNSCITIYINYDFFVHSLKLVYYVPVLPLEKRAIHVVHNREFQSITFFLRLCWYCMCSILLKYVGYARSSFTAFPLPIYIM